MFKAKVTVFPPRAPRTTQTMMNVRRETEPITLESTQRAKKPKTQVREVKRLADGSEYSICNIINPMVPSELTHISKIAQFMGMLMMPTPKARTAPIKSIPPLPDKESELS